MNRIIKYITIVFLSISMVSCDSFLDVDVPDNLIHQEFWSNKDQVDAALNGLYTSLHNNLERFHAWGDVRSSLYIPGSDLTSSYREFFSQDIYPENGLVSWSNVYVSITWINSFLKNAPSTLERDDTFKDSELQVMMGEAHALRALNYFYLVRAFKEVPIIDQPYESDTQEINTAASSEEEVLDFIEADLAIALEKTSENFDNVNLQYGRITKNAVRALWADVKLWRNQYQEVLNLTASLDQQYESSMVAPLDWFTIFNPGNSSESIFEYQYVQTGLSSPLYNWFSQGQRGDAKFLANITNISVNAGELLYPPRDDKHFSADTIRLKNFSAFMLNPRFATGNGTGYEVYKFTGQTAYQLSYRPAGSRNVNYIFYRYREILLMQAEALAMLGRYPEAESRLNIIREHTDLPQIEPGGFSDGPEFMNLLLMEREFELGFEGKEWFAAVRVSRRPGYENVLIEKAANNSALGASYQVIRARLLEPESWFLPYYETEIETNQMLEQKDYYKNK